MAVTKITWENKTGIQNDASVARKNKVVDEDMNEIKQVVNNNANEVTTMQETIEDLQEGQGTSDTDITNLKNRVTTLEKDNTENKSNISSLQEQFSNFENYDDTEIKEDIEKIQTNDTKQDELISKLKNALINVETEESKSIHIKDASILPAQLNVEGNHEQDGEPSPINPVPVVCVGSNADGTFKGSIEISKINENLLKLVPPQTKNAYGLDVSVDEEGIITINGTANGFFPTFLITGDNIEECQGTPALESNPNWYNNLNFPASDYSFKFEYISGNGGNQYRPFVYSFALDGQNNYILQGNTTKIVSYTGSIGGIGFYVDEGQTYDNFKFRIIAVKGTYTDSNFPDFTINQQTDYNLPIQQEMLQGDYFVKEDDGWKEVHTWGKIIFNGTEGWYVQNSENSSIFQWTLPATYNLQQATKEGSAFCNHFKQIQNEQLLKTQDGMLIIYKVDTSYIRINNSNITNVEDFKSWLQQKNSEGKPVYIFYKTITPTKLACTEEQSAVLEELNNLDLFKGVNNIITTEDIALLKLNYIADTKTYVDNKYNQLANQIQQVGKL